MNKRNLFIILFVITIILFLGIFSFFFFKDDVEDVAIEDYVKEPVIINVDVEEDIAEEQFIFPDYEHDKDHDGMSDEEELSFGTSDLEFDSDDDGLSDLVEINKYGTDPTKRDSDDDGHGDAIEIINGYDPLGPGKL